MARKISVEIVGDARSLEKAFAKSSRSAKRFQGDMTDTATKGRRGFGVLGKGIGLVAGALGTAGLVGAAKAAFEEMGEAQKVTVQTRAVLKSTGKAAKVSEKQITGMAESLMLLSGVDDEAIQSGENLLLTFTNIRNEVGRGNDIFDQATRTMLDMSVALGQDMKQSAIQLGKALNDPIKGVGALRRVGVQFTQAQQDQIEALTRSGHRLQAQKLILAELRREFGGSAKAAGQTLPGKLAILTESLRNLGGTIATKLAPKLAAMVDQWNVWLQDPEHQREVINSITSAIEAMATAFEKLAAAIRTAKDVFDKSQALLRAPRKLPGAGRGGGGLAGGLLGVLGKTPLAKLVPGGGGGFNIQNQTVNVYGVTDPRQLEDALWKRTAGRGHRRRGAR